VLLNKVMFFHLIFKKLLSLKISTLYLNLSDRILLKIIILLSKQRSYFTSIKYIFIPGVLYRQKILHSVYYLGDNGCTQTKKHPSKIVKKTSSLHKIRWTIWMHHHIQIWKSVKVATQFPV